MLLQVIHETTYHYTPSVKTAQHMAHLKPVNDQRQRLLAHELTVHPVPTQHSESRDVYGNTRAFFSLSASHDELEVRARSLVSTQRPKPVKSEMPWEQARER